MKGAVVVIGVLSLVLVSTYGLSQAADTAKLGATYGLTGRIGWIGQDCVDGAQLAVKEINAAGGIEGKMVEIVSYDSKNDPDIARTNVEKLLKQDKALAILGPVATSESLAVLPIVQKYKTPTIVVSGGLEINSRILPEHKKDGKKCYMWALSVGTPRQNEAKTLWLSKAGKKKLGNIEPLDQMGDLSAEMYKQWASKYGLEVVISERFDNAGKDFTTQMAKIKAAGADCIGSMCSGGPSVILVKNRDQVGMQDLPFLISDANLSKQFIQLLGENTKNVFTVGAKISYADYLPADDPQKKFIDDFKARFAKEIGRQPKSWFFASVGYDSALLFLKGMQAVGTDGEKVRDWMESQKNFKGAQAFYSFSDLDHRGIGLDQCAVLVIEKDDWVPAK